MTKFYQQQYYGTKYKPKLKDWFINALDKCGNSSKAMLNLIDRCLHYEEVIIGHDINDDTYFQFSNIECSICEASRLPYHYFKYNGEYF